MSPVYLFQITSERTQWLSARQSLIADNVANANTPGFQARDLPSFSATLDHAAMSMATTDPAHMAPTQAEFDPARAEDETSANATLSGNSVNLQDEMIKLGEVSRDYSATTNIKKVFHQMMLAALK